MKRARTRLPIVSPQSNSRTVTSWPSSRRLRRDRLDGAELFLVGLDADRREPVGDRDPQPSGRGLCGFGERRPAVLDGVGQAGGVLDRASQRAEDSHAAVRLDVRRGRDPAALGLEAEEPAAGGGDADRAGAVGAERGARHPGGDGGRAAAARAAARTVRVPRVAGDAEGRRLGERGRHQLRHVGLAEDHGAGLSQARDDLGVGGLWLRIGVAAVRGDLTLDVDVVLDRDGDAVQREALTAAIGGVGLGERFLGEDDPERVEQRVQPGDPGEEELRELAGGDARLARSGPRGGRARRRRGRRGPRAAPYSSRARTKTSSLSARAASGASPAR